MSLSLFNASSASELLYKTTHLFENPQYYVIQLVVLHNLHSLKKLRKLVSIHSSHSQVQNRTQH
ncbi:hypothetical protein QR685DRAFT_559735 [Neurospora intermedia]|uniref:Uncharacterized protein n=1 Tax=Neurospora intermedia TaxID=5142 RepID=A0ABR3DVH5_NEUIN